jgi:hypothetical protein
VVSKSQHALHFRAADAENVQIDLRIATDEHPMLPPIRLANAQLIADWLKRRDIASFVARIGHEQNDVDDRLCRQTGNGSRAHVLDSRSRAAEDTLNTRGFSGK